jgi:WD40 repeat protein
LVACRDHIGQVLSVAFSPDGRLVAAGNAEGEVDIWNAQTGEEMFPTKHHRSRVYGVAFSPDGSRLASASADRTVKIWDVASGAELSTLAGSGTNVFTVTFGPDGRHLASGTWDGKVQYWDVPTGRPGRVVKPLLTLRGPGDVRSVAISPDGQLLAAAGYDCTAKVYDLSTGQELCTFQGHTGPLFSIAFTPDGARVATASFDGSIKIWDAGSARELMTMRGHLGPVNSVAFSPDGRRLVSGSKDRTVKVWDVTKPQGARNIRIESPGSILKVALSADGRKLAAVGGARKGGRQPGLARYAYAWDLNSGETIRVFGNHPSGIVDIAFSPNGQSVATAAEDGSVKIWKQATAAELRQLQGHSGPVNRILYSPDGVYLASAGADKIVQIWDSVAGRSLAKMEGHTGAVTCLDFSPDSRTVATGSEDRSLRFWDAATGQEYASARITLTGTPSSVVYSPDARYVAATDGGETIQLWELSSEQQPIATVTARHVLHGHTFVVTGLSFSPDGKRLASSGMDFKVKVWNPASGDEVLTLQKDAHHATSVAFSPDGRRLVSSGGGIHVWEIETRDATVSASAALADDALAWHRQEASECLNDGHWYGAVFHLSPLLKAWPNRRDLLWKRFRAYAALGEWEKASADCFSWSGEDVGNPESGLMRAGLFLLAHDSRRYEEACRKLLDRHNDTRHARTAYLVARSCALAPCGSAKPTSGHPSDFVTHTLPLAQRAVKMHPNAWHLHTLGLAYYRAEKYQSAIQQLWNSMITDPSWNAHIVNWLTLSMAYARTGRDREARAFLQEAVDWIDRRKRELSRADGSVLALDLHDWVSCELLLREARAVLNGATR